MNIFELGLNKSIEELKTALLRAKGNLNDKQLHQELNYKLGNCLHWTIDYWERVEKLFDNIPAETIAYFSALRYANNLLKHEVLLTKLFRREGGFSFPIEFPFEIPEIRYIWSLSPQEQTRNIHQLENYRKYLENKDIMETILNALGFLKEYALS